MRTTVRQDAKMEHSSTFYDVCVEATADERTSSGATLRPFADLVISFLDRQISSSDTWKLEFH